MQTSRSQDVGDPGQHGGDTVGKAELEPARGAQAIEGEVQGRGCVRQGIIGREGRLVDPVTQLQW